ncbi:LysR family transcriptional regulator [Cedecea neteri]|uniref:LysR family transcriptional regulator n=1 Tax=Cedecea neteri TaxID=158822 RepID=UPI0004F5900C|nr:LysR family transcriptional regulator [Cedecea neteri]AIR67190.1 LysR family transcriptional regulator [Cedecea neteri]
MLDGISLDQLRTFIAAVDEGSFSAAARKMYRAQSVISDLIKGLEAQIGVQLFDRSGRYPKLTPEGEVLLIDARCIVSGVDFMKARARGMSSGLESELSVVVDVFFPLEAMTSAAKAFREQFPGTPLRLFVEALGGGYKPVLNGSAGIGILGSLPDMPASLTGERLTGVSLVMVAAPDHPLAQFEGMVPKAELTKHVQLVLTDRSELSKGKEFGVMSPSTWRLGDLLAKHAFLLDGLGWGSMPSHVVERDIREGRLVRLSIEDVPPGGLALPMFGVYPIASPPGPAGRWLIERLKNLCPAKLAASSPKTSGE